MQSELSSAAFVTQAKPSWGTIDGVSEWAREIKMSRGLMVQATLRWVVFTVVAKICIQFCKYW